MPGFDLTHLIIPAVLALIFVYIQKITSKSIVANEQGQVLMRLPKFYGIVMYLGLAFMVAVFVGMMVSKEPMEIGIVVFFVGMAILSLLGILYYRNHYVLYDQRFIEVRNLFGKVKVIEWTNVKDAGFIPGAGLMTLKDHHGQKVYIHYQMLGIDQFLRTFESKTPWTAAAIGFPRKKTY